MLLPLVISTSYAFMLPVATPTNAVVFSTNYLTIKDLVIILFYLYIALILQFENLIYF